METKNNKPRIIISGGGTGGHIFPAVSIANAIKELCPDSEILFVGAEGRMEMQRVPDAGYKIIGLPVAGFDRKHLWKNFAVLVKLARSQWNHTKGEAMTDSQYMGRANSLAARVEALMPMRLGTSSPKIIVR